MSEAFTVRLRTGAGGRVSFWLAPAGGMGLSFPCCDAGHVQQDEALSCGAAVLSKKLLTPLAAAS